MSAFKFNLISQNLLSLCCILCLLSLTAAQDNNPYLRLDERCYNTSTNRTFQSNLNFLLSTLPSNASRAASGFYNSTAGAVPQDVSNTVYALFLCRGDVSSDVCEECVARASKDAQDICPDQTTAIIWYDTCMLRYSSESIFSRLDTSEVITQYASLNVSDPDRFNQVLLSVMDAIAKRASNLDSGKYFAVQEAKFSESQSLYALGQCTPDLSGGDCYSCLRTAISVLPNCCLSRLGARILLPSCNIRFENWRYYNITTPSPPSPPLPPPSSPPASSTEKRRRISTQIIIAIVISIFVASLLLLLAFCFLASRSRKRYKSIAEKAGNAGIDISTMEPLQYNLSAIQVATNNFDLRNKIGEGGFGQVYKGTLPNGQEIAVKRLSRSSAQGVDEFRNEILLVAQLQHRNLVRVLGYCLEGEEKALIYEFVPNNSLDYFLFGTERQQLLDWSTRYQIIKGIARGLLYLHEDSRLRIIHRDLKASNVLIDGTMNPKIADFGMARLFAADQTKGSTSKIAGTYGYMAPEYVLHGHFSVKSDVFSLGVLILEIVSGKKNSSFGQPNTADSLLSYAWKQWINGTPLALLDPNIADSCARHEVIRSIHIGLLCAQEDAERRPNMASVVLMLNSFSLTMATPHAPAFFIHSKRESPNEVLEADTSTSTEAMARSLNEVSITELLPR